MEAIQEPPENGGNGRAATWLVYTLAGLALSGAIAMSVRSLQRVSEVEHVWFKHEAEMERRFAALTSALAQLDGRVNGGVFLELKDLQLHVPPPIVTRRLEENERAIRQLQDEVRNLERGANYPPPRGGQR